MLQPEISVIVPVYNVETYLPQCLKSIAEQSFDDYEVLLIDDGSTDQSGEICNRFVLKDPRFRVYHKSNGGVSSARNWGINQAVGKWLYFIDADDWIESYYLEQFHKAISTCDADLVIQSYIIENGNQVYGPSFPDRIIQKAYQVVELLEHTKDTHCGWIWHRLFKKSIIEKENIRFYEDTAFGEDEIFFMEYVKYAKETRVLSSRGHHYIIHSNSLTFKLYPLMFYYEMLLRHQKGVDGVNGNWWFNSVVKKTYINKFIDLWFVFLFSKYQFEEDTFRPLFKNLRQFVINNKLYLLPCQSLFALSYRYSLILIENPHLLYRIWWKIKRAQNIFHSII